MGSLGHFSADGKLSVQVKVCAALWIKPSRKCTKRETARHPAVFVFVLKFAECWSGILSASCTLLLSQLLNFLFPPFSVSEQVKSADSAEGDAGHDLVLIEELSL